RKVVKNLIQFYACSPGEFSHESATLSHGVYSYFLAKGVGGEADLDNDGNIDVKELDKYACDNTLRYVRDELKKAKQTPQYFGDLRANPRIATLKDKKLRQQLSEDFRAFALGVDSQEDFVVKFLSANAPSKITLWKDGADKGIVEGEYLYGLCLLYGVSVEKSLSKAVEFFRKAAEQGNAYAQFNLGNCYYNGDGVVRDQEVAISWYRKSAEQEYSAAKSFITNIDNNAKIKSEQREKEQAEKERIEKEQAEKERIEKERAKDEELERLRKELVRAREEELERLRKEKDEYEKNKNKNSGNTSSQSSNNNNTNSNNGNTSNNYNYPSTGWTDMGTINGAQVYRDNSAKKEWTVVLGQVRSAENGSSARSKVAALGFRLPSFRELQQMESNGGRRYLNVGNGYYETNDPSILGNPATNGFRTPQKRTGLGRNYYIGVRQSR
ncbi:MAG: hypothetical protein LBI18_01380, partial [Planctomycetaceae bacterium]|nr:hypothetical protein [Planctomycetaceae bacterium]